ncbi:MAG: ATP-binding protein [Alphaproteobacteria bacterium]|nr:ATP-binding protein [Alphaproteobacteria bacterium]
MLIGFTVTNYRSIRETQTLSMVPTAGKEHHDTHTCASGIRAPSRLLRCAIIYGPNAAGKTNILKALAFMKAMVVSSVAAIPTGDTSYDPFLLSSESRTAPSEFEVSFAQGGTLYEYGFKITAERIHEEWLIELPSNRKRELFRRIYNERNKNYEWKFSNTFKGNRLLWRDATRSNALFLSVAAQFNSVHLLPVFAWFQSRIVMVHNLQGLNVGLTLQLLATQEGKSRLLPFVREADPGIADVEIKREAVPGAFQMPIPGGGAIFVPGQGQIIVDQAAPNATPDYVRISFSHNPLEGSESVQIPLDEESAGTRSLFMAAGAWLNVLRRGEILLFDEIDTSLHPLLTRFLIQQFHSDDTNPNGAQLICTTHDTTLLDADALRRDQIWFVEKGSDRATTIFPLSDFSPRKDEALEKAYLKGRYGALPIFDSVDG